MIPQASSPECTMANFGHHQRQRQSRVFDNSAHGSWCQIGFGRFGFIAAEVVSFYLFFTDPLHMAAGLFFFLSVKSVFGHFFLPALSPQVLSFFCLIKYLFRAKIMAFAKHFFSQTTLCVAFTKTHTGKVLKTSRQQTALLTPQFAVERICGTSPHPPSSI